MDAQSRGRGDSVDPADQWVLNPQTGSYELRLDQPPAQPSAATSSSRDGATPPPRDPAAPPVNHGGHRAPGPRSPEHRAPGQQGRRAGAPGREVPAQRSRHAGDASGGQPPGAGRRKRKPAANRKKKALMWTGGTLAFVLVAGGIGAYLVYQHFESNLSTVDVAGAGSGGFKKDQAVNILVIGTDKRTGKGNGAYGDKNSAGHADTTILFHVSKDRTNATALSIPRDLVMDIPDCETKTDGDTKVIPGTPNVRFNESLGQFGRDPGCTMRSVKELTGIEVDHFMMADFNAVKTMSTAVGGVPVCLAKDINDVKSKLNLPAGTHNIQGEQALAFVRTRSSVGHGSDLSRIEIQQQFLSSLIRKMKSGDTLTNPAKLWDLAEAATSALTVDTGIGSISKLQTLALELAKVNPKNITFTTVPVLDNPDRATVRLNEEQARPLFAMIQNDTSLTEVEQKAKAAKAAQAGLLKGPRAEPSEVRVKVLNGSETRGVALSTLRWLQLEQGVAKSSNEGNAPEKLAKTQLEFAPNQADQARKVADLMGLPATALKQGTTPAGELDSMTLTLGADFKGAGVPITGPAKAPAGVQKVEADKQVCAK
ncbi:LCP family protein [Streptomyces sp. NPDC057638]|uniref:LCP family protein n=1 Tax=Streptomyces sp. NPDC057638 TaxID=3346190 RepID=UPI0036C476DD